MRGAGPALTVEDALARMLEACSPVESETVTLDEALGRTLAEDVVAQVSHPPCTVSAMDGYAVRAADVAKAPVSLAVIGTAPAGRPFTGRVGPGEAVRIFTGGVVPEGADAIVIQEDADEEGEGPGRRVTVRVPAAPGRHVRPEGQDFHRGEIGIAAGEVVSVRHLALIAAMNVPRLKVRRRPRVAILSAGDELVEVGDAPGPAAVVNANAHGLAAFARAEGAQPLNLGIARDDLASLCAALQRATGADLLVTTGGASVGEHDLMRKALDAAGFDLAFWKIALKPGKPTLFGRLGTIPVLGLPGNPVSALVGAILFLRPLIARLSGARGEANRPLLARLTTALGANSTRQDYLRAQLGRDERGALMVTPFSTQDSAMLAPLARSDGLIVRPPLAPPAAAGTEVPVIPLGGSAIRV